MPLSLIESIPIELTVREHPITFLVGLGMFMSFILISLAKLMNGMVYINLALSFTKNKSLSNFLKGSFPVFQASSLLLILNYILSFCLILVLLFNLQDTTVINGPLYAVLIPIAWFLFSIFSYYFSGIIAGESQVVGTPILMKINGAQVLGLILSVVVFLWTLGFIDQSTFIYTSVVLVLVENVIRLIRTFMYVLGVGVPWYYIIMYLCTLEILPLTIVYYYWQENLK